LRADGILDDATIEQLSKEADDAFVRFGMELYRDERSGLAAYVPRALLTERQDSDDGVLFSTPDGELTFTTAGFPAEGATLDVIREVLAKPDDGKIVSYQSTSNQRAVVSGSWGDHHFYSHFIIGADRVLGYNVNWTENYRSVGPLVAVFAASFSAPIAVLDTESKPADAQSSRPRFGAGSREGAFLLPDNDPSIVILDGDIQEGAPLDFIRALRKRPQIKTVVLNSGGGYVQDALLIAHEVARRHLSTAVPDGAGCYSACAYVFLAGEERTIQGQLGVHQIYGDQSTVETAQFALSDVLDALTEFGVAAPVVSLMLRTPPNDMHIFTARELQDFGIVTRPVVAPPVAEDEAAFVQFGSFETRSEAEAELVNIRSKWGSLLAGRDPFITTSQSSGLGGLYKVRVGSANLDLAQELCQTVKAGDGSCFASLAN
jgi:hypothetical protein